MVALYVTLLIFGLQGDELVSVKNDTGSFIWHPIFENLHGANIVSLNVASVIVVFFSARRYVVFTVCMRTTSK